MSYVDEKKVFVASYKEIVLIFVTFSVILFMLYPKDLLKHLILKETSNYDLSMLYLNNMLKQDPSNESLMLMLADQSLRSGKRDLAYRLLKLLLNSKQPQMKERATLLSYQLAKQDYYFVADEKKKLQIKKDMTSLFINIVKNRYYTNKTLDDLYKESLFLDLKNYSYYLLQEKIASNKNDIKLLTDAYYLADSTHKDDSALAYLHLLEVKDKVNKDKWFYNEYYYYMKKGDTEEAQSLLLKNAKNSALWNEELAKFYLSQKQQKKASQIYMELYNDADNATDKKEFFIEALRSLQAGNYMKEAADLGYQYESVYIKDANVRVFLLKLYLAAGDLQKATKLSKRILTNGVK